MKWESCPITVFIIKDSNEEQHKEIILFLKMNGITIMGQPQWIDGELHLMVPQTQLCKIGQIMDAKYHPLWSRR